jgi:hypothetical protein
MNPAGSYGIHIISGFAVRKVSVFSTISLDPDVAKAGG